MKNKHDFYLQFDFAAENEKSKPLIFSKPEEIITTFDSNEVEKCLKRIESAVEKGYYAAGFFSYEAVDACTAVSKNTKKTKLPLLWFGLFQKTENTISQKENTSFHVGEWRTPVSKADYTQQFNLIQEGIREKKISELNFTIPFSADFSGNSYGYYQQLKKAQNANYSAYLSIGDFAILSASPELFFEIKNKEIHIRPMKGTIHRGLTYEQDLQQKEWLLTSEKNKYENQLTIAEMAKELSPLIEPDTLAHYDTFRVEKYPTLYQMTSAAKGKLKNGIHTKDIFKALFPCTSIAGVPKKESIEWIKQVETSSREVYCGSIGYITPDKNAIFNVAIRSVWIDKENKAHYHAGGAVTKYSKAEEEYKEIFTKTKVTTWKQPDFELLETMAFDGKDFFLLEKHIERLQNSAAYFDFSFCKNNLSNALESFKKNHGDQHPRVRLTMSSKGEIHLQSSPLTKHTDSSQKVVFAKRPIRQNDVFLYHKTTHRSVYEEAKKPYPEYFDVLLWNEKDEITEFTIGNIVVERDGKFLTPPIACGLLPGTFRQDLIEKGILTEHVLLKKDLLSSDKLWLINSVREWVSVELTTSSSSRP